MLTLEKRFPTVTNQKNGLKNNLEVNVIDALSTEIQRPAMSSRNERLTNQQREDGSLILNLKSCKRKIKSNSATAVTQWVEESFKTNTSFKLEYFQIADETTLKPCLRKKATKKYRAFIAVTVNNIRLIDTISLN
jgi:pantoate--beta-alanine ligase